MCNGQRNVKTNRARIRTRWRQAKASTRLFWRAVIYGIASATCAGFAIGAAFSIETGAALRRHLAEWLTNFSAVGLTYGLVASPVFALVMTILARWLYRENRHAFRFKLVMGVCTLIGVGVSAPYMAVFVALRKLLDGRITLDMIVIFLMWGFGVYLSQIIARQYIAEYSPRKRKDKPSTFGAMPAAGDSIDGG